MAKKLPGLSRVLDERSIASVAFGEIGSSIYFALGVIALYALGLTPWVILFVGLLFLVVALSYAEGTAAIPETGGAATLVRRAFNDPLGFLTGWALFLDYLIVIGLAALFVPHYFGHAVQWLGITHGPWDVVVAVFVIALVALVRLVRRPAMYRLAVVLALLSIVACALLVVLGLSFFSFDGLTKGVDPGTAPTWRDLAFSLPLAMLAFTGLETVANLAAETREPGRTLPRSLFGGIGAAVAVSVAMAIVGIMAFPAESGTTTLGEDWIRAPLVGIASALRGDLPAGVVDAIRAFVGLSGVLVLLAAIATSMSGAGRLAYALGKHEMLPHAFGRLNRRTLIAPVTIISVAAIASALLVGSVIAGRPVRSLAGLYSFGVLLTFTAAQLAVIRLRTTEPQLRRPFKAPGTLRVRGREVPLAAAVGAPLTFAIWIITMVTHDAARVVGPFWLAAGAVVFVAVRRSRGEQLMRAEPAIPDLVPEEEGMYERILVPMKIGVIGEEVLGTALKLAEERNGQVRVIHVVRVPLDRPLDASSPDEEERAAASLAEAKLLASEQGVNIETDVVRARAIGEAIVEKARETNADLIVLGSAPKWRRQSRFFSPTVDYVLKKAPSEVMVIAYPQGVLEEEAALS
jgi:APA family basic amino acid/polyamine antiporter